MDLKPVSLYIGLVDFFSILLPGALLTFVLRKPVYEEGLMARYTGLPTLPDGPAAWGAFVVVAYMLGHIVHMLGSQLDRPYDRLRRRLWPDARYVAYGEARRLQTEKYGVSARYINTYRWSKTYLAVRKPELLQDIHRLEADSKFFRSLVVMFLVLMLYFLAYGRGDWPLLLGLVAGAGLAASRYVQQRYKSTRTAYEYVIALECFPTLPKEASVKPVKEALT